MTGIIRSVLITLSVSGTIGLIYFLTKGMFWVPFGLAIAIQFIIFFVANTALDMWYDIQQRKANNEMLEEFAKLGRDVQCAWCQEPAYVPIDLSIKNSYTCGKCDKDNAITIIIETAQTTQPTTISSQQTFSELKHDK